MTTHQVVVLIELVLVSTIEIRVGGKVSGSQ